MAPARRLRAAWGFALLVFPGALMRAGRGEPTRAALIGARALGLRHLIEVAILDAGSDPRPPGWMTAVDVLHAGSMLAVARFAPGLRRDALLSAAAAGGLITLSLAER